MADFAAVLRKTIDGLKDNTPEMRHRVYEKARATIESKLAAVTPPPPAALADRQRRHLEDAIATVEAEYSRPEPEPEPEPIAEPDGLDRVLADLDPHTIRQAPATLPPLTAGGQAEPPAADAGDLHGLDRERTGSEAPWPYERVEQKPDRAARPRRSRAGLIAALVLLLVVIGGGAAAWINRDRLDEVPGYDKVAAFFERGPASEQDAGAKDETGTDQAANGQPGDQSGANQPQDDQAAASSGSGNDVQAPDTAASATPPEKFTQRLTANGEEVDEGPANDEASVGEGTSVAQASDADQANGAPATAGSGNAANTDANAQQVPVGQKAIFYEERTNAAQGSAETGNIVWSLVQESPGDDQPPEPAIRGEATIPGKNLQLRITIKRNADKSLPASHIVEMIFLTPDDFPGGGIDNVLRISMKQSEQDTGNPLLGIPAKIADGFFLFALNNSKAEEQTNLLLMKRQEWIDIPLVYKSGRRALMTMEKGIPGDKVFDEALEAWSKESSG